MDSENKFTNAFVPEYRLNSGCGHKLLLDEIFNIKPFLLLTIPGRIICVSSDVASIFNRVKFTINSGDNS